MVSRETDETIALRRDEVAAKVNAGGGTRTRAPDRVRLARSVLTGIGLGVGAVIVALVLGVVLHVLWEPGLLGPGPSGSRIALAPAFPNTSDEAGCAHWREQDRTVQSALEAWGLADAGGELEEALNAYAKLPNKRTRARVNALCERGG